MIKLLNVLKYKETKASFVLFKKHNCCAITTVTPPIQTNRF